MNERIESVKIGVGRPQALGESLTSRICRSMVLKRLDRLTYGTIELRDTFGSHVAGNTRNGPRVVIHAWNLDFYRKLAQGGTIGAGESYMDGDWECDDLAVLVRIMARNRSALAVLDSPLRAWQIPFDLLAHLGRYNSKRHSRQNIHQHYDLGNDFFKLFLDETMMYSGAYFSRPDMALEQASVAKLERICQKLQLTADDHVLEIGSGWGSLAIYMAFHYDCQVTTTTISEEQFRYVSERINSLELGHRIRVLKADYRDLKGQYDKVVSIEMLEAVGHHYFLTYFAQCAQLLKPGGAMLVQSITIRDQNYESARRSVDFIQKYIFPGGALPSVSKVLEVTGRHTDLALHHLEEWTPYYAETLRRWHKNFEEKLGEVRALGFDEKFIRMWRFYLKYCEGGFDERVIGLHQFLFHKPDNRTTLVTAIA